MKAKFHSNPLLSLPRLYESMSTFGKVLLLLATFLIIVYLFRLVRLQREGFEQPRGYIFKEGVDVYDAFYAEVYDFLVFNNTKDDFEVGEIINSTVPSSKSVILDVGCGTGHHVEKLSQQGLTVIGLDNSPDMIAKAKENFPNNHFQLGDALDSTQFHDNTFTHILCLYFTLYYFEDKRKFFNNCFYWLMPGGTLIVHVVNREKFDPILPAGNPLYIVSPQKYAKERITKTKITFNEFVYSSNFDFDFNHNLATFEEKFKFNDGGVRKQEHKLYMEDEQDIVNLAQDIGFIVQGKVDMMACAYDNQYLYILVKPE